MMRTGWVGLLTLVVAGSGCAGAAKRDDGTLMFKPRAWSAAPAPDQVAVASITTPSTGPAGPVAKLENQGLSRYFPTLRKGMPEKDATRLASSYHPSWFGLKKSRAATQVYTTDARPGLDRSRGPAGSSLLPVAIRVPTDSSVRPTAAEEIAIPDPAKADAPKVADRMPNVPAIDPLQPRGDREATTPAEVPERAEPAKGEDDEKGDEKAVQAHATPTDPAIAPGLPEPTLPASYVRRETMSAPAHEHVHGSSHAGPVLASPQVQPTVHAAPSRQIIAARTPAKKWQPHCLRNLVRKTWKLGEVANPPTTRPH